MLVGLVGKPSSGKSTFFNALTMQNVPMASYPFTTINPNIGTAFVRVECIDKEFGVQCNPRSGYCKDGTRYVPVEVIDVAGLVPGAHEGRGRGNAFLSDLSRADVLIHVIDASGSTNEQGEQVGMGQHDPCKDVQFLEEEIDYWFFGVLKKNWLKFAKIKMESKSKLLETMQQNLSGIGADQPHIEAALTKTRLVDKRLESWSEDEMFEFARELRRSSKPIVIAANKFDLPTAAENIKRMKGEFSHLTIIGCSAISELTLKKASKDGAIEYHAGEKGFKLIKELSAEQMKGLDYIKTHVLEKLGSTGVQELIDDTVFNVLKYIAVFPAGTKKLQDSQGNTLPDCFLIPGGSTALDFAFKLHTDIGKGFIKAIDVKTKLAVGKEHPLKNRDAIEIVHNK